MMKRIKDLEVGQRWRHRIFDVDRVIIGVNFGVHNDVIITWYTDLGTDEDGNPYTSKDGFNSGYFCQGAEEFILSSEYLVETNV